MPVAGLAQYLFAPEDPRLPEIRRQFDQAWSGQQDLKCSVERYTARLSYTLRYVSSFNFFTPARQFIGSGRQIALVMRVTPQPDGTPRYLAYTQQLQEVKPDVGRKAYVVSGAGFVVGVGKYKVEAVLVDNESRTCGKSWTETVKPVKDAELAQAPGTVASLNLESWKGLAGKPEDRRLTVFLHVAPLYRRRFMNHLSAYDRGALLGSLASILNQSDFGKVRLVAFDLLGKRVLFRTPNLDAREFWQLNRTLEGANFGSVDAKTLQRGPSDTQLLDQLIREELGHSVKSDAVLFLGAEGYMARNMPETLESAAQDLPPSLYVGFLRFPVPMEDAMFQVVRKAKGKRIMLVRPQDLVNAIKALNNRS